MALQAGHEQKGDEMMKRILVPLDGSEMAECVLPYVKLLARGLHAKVNLLQVFEPRVPDYLVFGLESAGALEVEEREAADERKLAVDYLSRIAGPLQAEGLDVSWEAVEGGAAARIIDLAQFEKAEIVVLSTHGRTGLERAVRGSVAEEVLRGVRVPVLLVKPLRKDGSRLA